MPAVVFQLLPLLVRNYKNAGQTCSVTLPTENHTSSTCLHVDFQVQDNTTYCKLTLTKRTQRLCGHYWSFLYMCFAVT